MWVFSSNIPLGPFAPNVLGWALGSKGKRVDRKSNERTNTDE